MQQENKILSRRISLIQSKLSDFKIDGIILLNIVNIRYLSGFAGSDGALIICPNSSLLLVDGRYTTQAALEVQNIAIIEYKDKVEGIIAAIKDLRLQHVGFEALSMSVDMHNQLTSRLANEELINIGNDLKTQYDNTKKENNIGNDLGTEYNDETKPKNINKLDDLYPKSEDKNKNDLGVLYINDIPEQKNMDLGVKFTVTEKTENKSIDLKEQITNTKTEENIKKPKISLDNSDVKKKGANIGTDLGKLF